jgi:hypothetical protein
MISHFYLSLCIPYETRVILQFGSVLWAYELCDSLISGNLLSIKFSFGNISIYICQLGEMGEKGGIMAKVEVDQHESTRINSVANLEKFVDHIICRDSIMTRCMYCPL